MANASNNGTCLVLGICANYFDTNNDITHSYRILLVNEARVKNVRLQKAVSTTSIMQNKQPTNLSNFQNLIT